MKGFKTRKLIHFVLTIALVATAIPLLGASAPAKKLYVNDTLLEAQPGVHVSNNVTMLPLKATAQTLGYTVSYHAVERSIKLVKGKETATVYLGKNQYVQGAGAAVKLSAASTAIGGQSVVPVDFFRAILNCGVEVGSQDVKIYQDPVLGAANQSLTVNAGDSFSVSLSENASTGYTWSFATSDGSPLNLVSTATVSPDPSSGLIGASGTKIWVFQALKAGKHTLTFTSKKGTAVGTTYQYTVQVAERTSKSPANVSASKLTMNKSDRLTITLTENSASGYAWNYYGIPKSTVETTTTVTTMAATAIGQTYTLPDGTTGAATVVGQLITDTAIKTSGGAEAISLVSRTTAINTKAEGFTDDGSLRTMSFRAKRSGTFEMKLEYNRSFAKDTNPKSVIYDITVK